MKNKIPLLFVLSLVVINVLCNSCKKDANSNIAHLLTSGTWQLATIQATNYIGDSQIGNADTLNINCDSVELMTFSANNTCTYTNYSCLAQKTTGSFVLTPNRTYFASDMVCKDTVNGETVMVKPFENTQIYTLGVYSLVLQTGDVQPNYSPTKRRRVVRYGFIKQKAVIVNN